MATLDEAHFDRIDTRMIQQRWGSRTIFEVLEELEKAGRMRFVSEYVWERVIDAHQD